MNGQPKSRALLLGLLAGLMVLAHGALPGVADVDPGGHDVRLPIGADEALVAPIDTPVPFFDAGGNQIRKPRDTDRLDPLRARLSRRRYWAEDRRLALIVQLAADEDVLADSHLAITLHRAGDASGEPLTAHRVEGPLPPRFALYLPLPEALMPQGEGALHLQWRRGETELGAMQAAFEVAAYDSAAPRAGRIPLRAANPGGVVQPGVPVTVGVPFPRGILDDAAQLRLVDEQGADIPLQVQETARWARFGTLKWVLCDFTLDFAGGPREVFLEYGEGAHRAGLQTAAVGRFSSEAGTGAAERSADGRPIRLPVRSTQTGEIGPTGAAHHISVDGRRWASMSVDSTPAGFPAIDTGRLRFDADGLWVDHAGTGDFVQVLNCAALSGAFVEHEDGRIYRPDPATPFEVEEAGPEKLVLRREGWYVAEASLAVGSGQGAVGSGQGADAAVGRFSSEAGTGVADGLADGRPIRLPVRSTQTGEIGPAGAATIPDSRFCRYVTRYVIHRDSPLVRIFHTWIFTGDGNRDRIANMGWALPLAAGMQPDGFLSAFGEDGRRLPGDTLLQYDYRHAEWTDGPRREALPGARTPGVAAARGNGVRLLLGIKDFWQNYPSELEFRDGTLYFHNWPRHNRPAGHTFGKTLVTEPGEAALPCSERYALEASDRLTRSEWKLNAVQLRYAHEGEMLDFRLPDAFGQNPIWQRMSNGHQAETHWLMGQPETANAQGIARTEEFWILLTPDDTPEATSRTVLEALNDETLRVHPDPAWLAASGAFYELHPYDPATYPEDERAYALLAQSFFNLIEHLGQYGMWLYGDIAAWNPNPGSREPELYRALRKRHHGWPFSWIPFARSGDARWLKAAETATRQMIDANWCHYVSDDLANREIPRRIGRWARSLVPWAGRPTGPTTYCYESQCDYLWHAWYLTGYHPARDNALAWSRITRQDPDWRVSGQIPGGFRPPITLLKSYLELYEATFDPWLLAAAQAIADAHLHAFRQGNYPGRLWETADREYLRFTGCPDYRELYLNYARIQTNPRSTGYLRRTPHLPPKAYAWKLTGDDDFLGRLVYGLDRGTLNVRTAEGILQGHSFTRYTLFAGYHLQWMPVGLWALERAGHVPPPISHTIPVSPRIPAEGLTVALAKPTDRTLPFELQAFRGWYGVPPRNPDLEVDYRIDGPDGQAFGEGRWRVGRRMPLEIPAEAPAGVYRVTIFGGSVALPLSDPGQPEVILQPHDTPLFNAFAGAGPLDAFWFRVPEGVERFSIALDNASRVTVWRPDRRRAWCSQDPAHDGPVSRIEIDVPPEFAGQLWRITPFGNRFKTDDQIPPYFAIDPTRWFAPE